MDLFDLDSDQTLGLVNRNFAHWFLGANSRSSSLGEQLPKPLKNGGYLKIHACDIKL